MFKQNKYMTAAGWLIALLMAALLVGMSARGKFMPGKMEKDGFAHLVYDEDTVYKIGFVEVACTILYLIPQTSVLGAVLLTGYLGGACASHVRVGDPAGNFMTPVVIGVLVWLALFLRDPRIRALLPFRSNPVATEIKL